MKKYIAILVGMLLIGTSCTKSDLGNEFPVSQNEEKTLMKTLNSLNTYVPMDTPMSAAKSINSMAVERTIVFQPSSGTFGVIPNPGYCSDFNPPLQMVIEGGGIATHIGRYTVQNLACVDVDGNILTPVLGFITAANGDVIYTQMGAPYPDLDNPPNFYYPYTVIGGSEGGRFEEAYGSIIMYGIVDYVTGTWTLSGEGTITY